MKGKKLLQDTACVTKKEIRSDPTFDHWIEIYVHRRERQILDLEGQMKESPSFWKNWNSS